MKVQFVLYTDDFKPRLGGVAEYAHQFAIQLNKNQLLRHVLTNQDTDGNGTYRVRKSHLRIRDRKLYQRFGDRIGIIRQVNTARFFMAVHYQIILDLIPYIFKKVVFIVPAYYPLYWQKFMVDWLRRLRIPYSLILHGLDILQHSKNKNKDFLTNADRAQFICFNSEASQALYLKSFGHPKTASLILYPGINLKEIDKIPLKSQTYVEQIIDKQIKDALVISVVAHLSPRKGIDVAIEAVNRLITKGHNIVYIIAGEGPEKANLERQIKQLNLKRNVFLLGKVDDQTKFSILNLSKVFLMPTRSLNNNDFEGFGISFIEASYFHNVVISGNHGGVKEAVIDGLTGFNIDADAADAAEKIAEKIECVMTDHNKCVAMTEAGKNFVKENYDWSVLFKRFQQVLNSFSA